MLTEARNKGMDKEYSMLWLTAFSMASMARPVPATWKVRLAMVGWVWGASISAATTTPLGPEPLMLLMSIPWAPANWRAYGVA